MIVIAPTVEWKIGMTTSLILQVTFMTTTKYSFHVRVISGVAKICCEEGQGWHSRRTSGLDAAAAL